MNCKLMTIINTFQNNAMNHNKPVPNNLNTELNSSTIPRYNSEKQNSIWAFPMHIHCTDFRCSWQRLFLHSLFITLFNVLYFLLLFIHLKGANTSYFSFVWIEVSWAWLLLFTSRSLQHLPHVFLYYKSTENVSSARELLNAPVEPRENL